MADIVSSRKRMKAACAVALCIIGILLLRLSLDQLQSYHNGVEDLKKGDYNNAVMYFERVLHAHIPFSPLEKRAKSHLTGLASKFEKEKEYELALLCYETIRTSRYLTRHFFIPGSKDIPFLNDRIASIKAQLLVKDGMVKDFKEGYDQQMGIMNKDYSPSVFWSAVAVAAFWAYIGFIVFWLFKRKKVYIYVSCLAFVIWVTGLYLA
ncbi:MAG: hypothetical protein ABSB95_10430 [Dissulfurispiraceae bacterium]